MKKRSELAKRMKRHEKVTDNYLTKRTPVLIRLDGKAFHTFTIGLKEPFDIIFLKTMRKTAKELVKNIQGAKVAYTQSDEITILLTDYDTLETEAWFDYRITKMIGDSVAIATLEFNRFFLEEIKELESKMILKNKITEADKKYLSTLKSKIFKARFDSRVFNIPKEDVNNNFIWRQRDCMKNSITQVAHKFISKKELHKKNSLQRKEMLLEKGIDYDKEYDELLRYGTVIFKKEKEVIIGKSTPIFSNDKNFINKYVFIGD